MIDYGMTLVTAPTVEPVTPAEAKAHCRVEIDDDNAYITALITAARQRVEKELPAQLCTATWRMTFDGFPGSDAWLSAYGQGYPGWGGGVPHHRYLPQYQGGGGGGSRCWDIVLPRGPAQSITSIIYVAADGTVTTLAADQYALVPGVEPARVRLAYGCVWPVARCEAGSVRVLYAAGYGVATAVPAPIKQAILFLVAHCYAQREPVITGAIATTLPLAVEWLLAPYGDGRYV